VPLVRVESQLGELLDWLCLTMHFDSDKCSTGFVVLLR
jgi:hypothetical protein